MDITIYDYKIKHSEICKKCNSFCQYKLIQTGNTEDFVSKKCPVCDTLHTHTGELYVPKLSGKNVMINTCPVCGSSDITKSIFTGHIWCENCSDWVTI